jgi:predicted component of type VI protein secretion system
MAFNVIGSTMMEGIDMKLRMRVIRGKPRGHFLLFPEGEHLFGRGPECDIRPNSDLVSRQHCLLQISETHVKIRDLGSINGTLVNGRLVAGEQMLNHGDHLQIGPLVLQVVIEAGGTAVCDTMLHNKEETYKAVNS